jgi:hypothetical protein
VSELPIDPLPPEIAALLEREKGAYPEDAAMKAAVLAHTELAVGLGLGGPGGAGGAGGASGGQGPSSPASPALPAAPPHIPLAATTFGIPTLAAVGLAAFVAGGVVGGAVMRPSPALPPSASAPAIVAPSVSSSAAPEPMSSAAPIASASAAARVLSPEPPASAAPSAPSARGDLVREREILDAAHAALAHGRAADALAAVQRHASQWPRGYLGEEREVVRIQALAASGRRGEAEQLAAQFRAMHPKSMLLPAVDAAVPPQAATPASP